MSARNTVVRTMHDLGLAAWFGGTLMGAVALNGGASDARDPKERLRVASRGWARWAPLQLGAMIIHGVGGVGLILGNKSRLAAQPEARGNTAVKLTLTVLAAASSLYAGILGARIARHADEGGEGVTEPDGRSSRELADAQRQQWVAPALTAVLIGLGAHQGEQQRPFAGLVHTLTGR